jgi:hypothetical protein
MEAIDDAWASSQWKAVLFADADLVVTAPFIDEIVGPDYDVALTPHYYPQRTNELSARYGYYNSGFMVARTPAFHKAWRAVFRGRPELFTDQGCLEEATRGFRIQTLDETFNVGVWRSNDSMPFEPLPDKCRFFHAHLFQPYATRREKLIKEFALFCLMDRTARDGREYTKLCQMIVGLDRSGWFASRLPARVRDV